MKVISDTSVNFEQAVYDFFSDPANLTRLHADRWLDCDHEINKYFRSFFTDDAALREFLETIRLFIPVGEMHTVDQVIFTLNSYKLNLTRLMAILPVLFRHWKKLTPFTARTFPDYLIRECGIRPCYINFALPSGKWEAAIPRDVVDRLTPQDRIAHALALHRTPSVRNQFVRPELSKYGYPPLSDCEPFWRLLKDIPDCYYKERLYQDFVPYMRDYYRDYAPVA